MFVEAEPADRRERERERNVKVHNDIVSIYLPTLGDTFRVGYRTGRLGESRPRVTQRVLTRVDLVTRT